MELEREVQALRNADFEAKQRKRAEEEWRRKEYVEKLTGQIEDKKARVAQSRAEFLRDREVVTRVVEAIVREEEA